MAEPTSAATHSRPVVIAPAPSTADTTPQGPNEGQATKPYTCVTCARRKVKCDKLFPTCTTCKRAKLECEYQEPAPRKRKRKPEDDILERLEYYEGLLKQNGIIPKEESTVSPGSSNNAYPSPFLTHKTREIGKSGPGKLLSGDGKTRYIDAGMWQNLGVNELYASTDEEDEEAIESQSAYQPTPAGDPVSAALLGPASPPSNLIALHPSYDSAMKLWTIYTENIDPIVKVVHVPTALPVLKRTASNPSTASKATEALTFAIYHIALMSINDIECNEKFGEPLPKLLARYYDATRQALVNAYFLRTTEIAVLQAYILFLLSVRSRYDPHTFWVLTGVATRIGQRMGLHRDGEDQGLKPFDVQVRRRVFWSLLPLDGLAGQICGTGITIPPESWDTRQPLNIDDTDIWPEMTEPPKERVGATDIMFCLARTELAKFIKKSAPHMGDWTKVWEGESIQDREKSLDELEAQLEVKYLRYCDFGNPLHNLVMAMARTSMTMAKLRIRLPRVRDWSQRSNEETKELWALAVKCIDYDIAAHNNANLSRFMWHLQAFFQWDPLIWILNDIRRDPASHQDDKVWDKIEKVYSNHPAMLHQRRALHIAVGHLVLKAWEASTAFAKAQETPPVQATEPPFITALRSLTSKRGSSRANSTAPSTWEYNPFNPPIDTMDNIGTSNFANVIWNAPDADFTRFGDFNVDSMDWMFWDQLVRDPSCFPAA